MHILCFVMKLFVCIVYDVHLGWNTEIVERFQDWQNILT
jgi:hypothetical protein